MRHASTISQLGENSGTMSSQSAAPSRSQRHLNLDTTRNIVIPSAARDLLFAIPKPRSFAKTTTATPSRSPHHLDLNTTRNIVIPSAARDLLFTLPKPLLIREDNRSNAVSLTTPSRSQHNAQHCHPERSEGSAFYPPKPRSFAKTTTATPSFVKARLYPRRCKHDLSPALAAGESFRSLQ